jgi:hypothetical protein
MTLHQLSEQTKTPRESSAERFHSVDDGPPPIRPYTHHQRSTYQNCIPVTSRHVSFPPTSFISHVSPQSHSVPLLYRQPQPPAQFTLTTYSSPTPGTDPPHSDPSSASQSDPPHHQALSTPSSPPPSLQSFAPTSPASETR